MDNQGTTSSNNNMIEADHVTVFVAYDGKWELDGKEWLFKESKGSIMVVSKYVTLSQMTTILCTKFNVNQDFFGLKLEVYYRVGFPIIEIQCDEDLSMFISESTKTKLLLCVTAVRKDDVAERVEEDEISRDIEEDEINLDINKESPHGRKDQVRVFVAYNGLWEWDDKEWSFNYSQGSIMVVSKYVTLLQMTDILCKKFDVNQVFYGLKLEVHYSVGSPWFPIIEIKCDEDLSLFISESSRTKPPLCVTVVRLKQDVAEGVGQNKNYVAKGVGQDGLKDDRVERRLMKAIQKGNWVKAREIVNNTEEVTWTSKLNDVGNTALHFAVGGYKADNEVVRDIVMGINRELLVTTINIDGSNPAHTAAALGNIEALKIMWNSNPDCLFFPDDNGLLPINYALAIPSRRTFLYLFKQMKSYKFQFDVNLSGRYGLQLLSKVIDTGLVDVAYELINDDPKMATQVDEEAKTPLEWIIRKPELFYSGTHYNLWQRFIYHYIPIRKNGFDSNPTADVENQETPKKYKFVTKYTRRCLHNVISRICAKLWETTIRHVPHLEHLKDDKVKHNTTIELLRRICEEIDKIDTSSEVEHLYSSPFCLAVENNNAEAIDVLTTYSSGYYGFRKHGWDICQLIVLNRSEKVYNYFLHHERNATTRFLASEDDDSNKILHLTGRLAPVLKLNASSSAGLQMQRELQWFEKVKRLVGITQTEELNKNKETPMMIFRRQHLHLRKDGENWIKMTADTNSVTAGLIITIAFAAAITVPGGNDSATGKPIYETKASLIIFAISDAISLFTSTTSLLLFLSILTARYADEDFLYMLPNRLIIGLVMLFVSVTSMMIAFSATLYIMFGQGKAWILIPIAALACLPIASFVTLQFPLLFELISSTYGHGIFGKEKDWQISANANKKKRA